MAASKKRGLGKGLDALFKEVSIDAPNIEENNKNDESQSRVDVNSDGSILYININDIKPNANQPRKTFDEEKLQELSDSIKEHGIIQPVILRRISNGYEIVAGERRWRAARKAGLNKLPCVVRELTDEQNMLMAIIENMQREDLNPIEEAEGLSHMIDTYGLTQDQVSKSIGKSRPYIANSLRLLKLSENVRELASSGEISAGHARTLAGLSDEELQNQLAKKVVKEGMSVRQLEKLVKDGNTKKTRTVSKKLPKSSDVLQVEDELKTVFGTKVNLNGKDKKGKIEIEYYSREELDRLIELLKSLG